MATGDRIKYGWVRGYPRELCSQPDLVWIVPKRDKFSIPLSNPQISKSYVHVQYNIAETTVTLAIRLSMWFELSGYPNE